MFYEMHAIRFLRPSHQVFYQSLKVAAKHPDSKIAYLLMLGCPRLQNACLDALHADTPIFSVKLITNTPYDCWKYPYFSQRIALASLGCKNIQLALFVGFNYKPLLLIENQKLKFFNEIKITNNPEHLEDAKRKFDSDDWQGLANRR